MLQLLLALPQSSPLASVEGDTLSACFYLTTCANRTDEYILKDIMEITVCALQAKIMRNLIKDILLYLLEVKYHMRTPHSMKCSGLEEYRLWSLFQCDRICVLLLLLKSQKYLSGYKMGKGTTPPTPARYRSQLLCLKMIWGLLKIAI